MHVEVKELMHPDIYRVMTLVDVADFYEIIGYTPVVLDGLSDDVVRLESNLKWPTLVFQKAESTGSKLSETSLFLKITPEKLVMLQKALHFTGSETLDPNGITIKFYT